MRRVLVIVGAALSVLIAVLVARELLFRSHAAVVEKIASPEVDVQSVALHLSQAVRFETVSHENADPRTFAPEQKMIIYSAQPGDPMATIKKLPEWHPFRSELIRLGVDIHHRTQRAPHRKEAGSDHPRAGRSFHLRSAEAGRRRLHAGSLERTLPLRGEERDLGAAAPEPDAGQDGELETPSTSRSTNASLCRGAALSGHSSITFPISETNN